MIQWRIEKDVKIDRLTLWSRRNSGEIHCRVVLLRIGFQQTHSEEYGYAHQYDLHCVACVNRESVLKKRSTEIPLHSKPIPQAALEKSVDELKSVQLRRSKKNKLK